MSPQSASAPDPPKPWKNDDSHSKLLTSAALAATLSACGTEAAIETPEDGTPVTMDWSKGETFYPPRHPTDVPL